MDKREYIRRISSAAEQYEKNLHGKAFLFVGRNNKDGSLSDLEAVFPKAQFMHLVGASSSLSASRFFDACIGHELKPDELEVSTEKQMRLKLEVIDHILKLPWTARMMGTFNGSGSYLYTEKFAGSQIACMGFVRIEGQPYYLPNTVLKADIRSKTDLAQQILAVYWKPERESLYQKEPTRVAAALLGKVLFWPNEIANKISSI